MARIVIVGSPRTTVDVVIPVTDLFPPPINLDTIHDIPTDTPKKPNTGIVTALMTFLSVDLPILSSTDRDATTTTKIALTNRAIIVTILINGIA